MNFLNCMKSSLMKQESLFALQISKFILISKACVNADASL